MRASVLQTPEQHEVYCDKFFTSHGSLAKLADQGIRVTRTVRDTRTGGCPLKSLKYVEWKKEEFFHYKCDGRSTHAGGTTMQSSVSSNYLSHEEPLRSAKHFLRRSSEEVDIPQTYLIKKYNESKGE
ncbi:hypothetical protein HPB50_008227 [Hyalomma asiaticum]|uniref:Uncharacterized protein n=1 Tax=Hyalomma asiaticum TaxID=266040 RepID=A0ACB7SFY7_HYAAI|nr:hypothetical protein HPB50_008227 [Hyalomma asiaticum]